jgi:hypothetical protein
MVDRRETDFDDFGSHAVVSLIILVSGAEITGKNGARRYSRLAFSLMHVSYKHSAFPLERDDPASDDQY